VAGGHKAKQAEQESPQERSDNADDEIADEAKAPAFDQLAGQPAGRQADQEKPKDIDHSVAPLYRQSFALRHGERGV
jgi:hypothetical protein